MRGIHLRTSCGLGFGRASLFVSGNRTVKFSAMGQDCWSANQDIGIQYSTFLKWNLRKMDKIVVIVHRRFNCSFFFLFLFASFFLALVCAKASRGPIALVYLQPFAA